MIFLVWVASSVITPARPTSLPVPAVVGMATIGAIASARARFHQSPTSSKSHSGPVLAGHERDHLAAVQRAAAAQRHHAVVAAAMEGSHAGLDIAGDRVRAHLGEQPWLPARRRAGSP